MIEKLIIGLSIMSDPLKNASRASLNFIRELEREKYEAKLEKYEAKLESEKHKRRNVELEMELQKQDRNYKLQMEYASSYIRELRNGTGYRVTKRNEREHRESRDGKSSSSTSSSSSTHQESVCDEETCNPGPPAAHHDIFIKPKRRKKNSQPICLAKSRWKDGDMDQKIVEGVVRFHLKKRPATKFFQKKKFQDWFKWMDTESHHMEDVIYQNDHIILVKCSRSKAIHFTDEEEFPPNSDCTLNLPVIDNGWTIENTKYFIASPTFSSFKKCLSSAFIAEECLGQGCFKLICPTPGKKMPYYYLQLFVREEQINV